MKPFIILIALIIVLVVGFRVASSVMSRDEPAPVTMTGDNDGLPGTDADTPEERAEERMNDQQQLLESRQDLEEQRTLAPLEQETERLESSQDLQEQRNDLAVEQQNAPLEMEQQRLQAEQELLEQQQAVIRERQELEELQREEQQRAMPPMPENNIKPVTEF